MRTAVLDPAAVGPNLVSEARAGLAHAEYTRFTRLNRGSYAYTAAPANADLLAAVTAIANEVTGRSLTLAEARVVRLDPGDFILTQHDRGRVYADHPVELVLDLSETALPGAEVRYRDRGQVFFTFPSTPGALAVVERSPTVMCSHTYVSKLQAASVVRWIALMRSRG